MYTYVLSMEWLYLQRHICWLAMVIVVDVDANGYQTDTLTNSWEGINFT